MTCTHEVTKLLASTLRKYWKCDEPAINKRTVELLEALDADLTAVEYGQSDETGDKMAVLEAAISDFEDKEDEPVDVVPKEDVEEEDEDDDDDKDEDDDVEDDEEDEKV